MRREFKAILILAEPARTRRDERILIRLLRDPRFDWPLFTRTAEAKLIGPFILFQLRKHELLDLVPPTAAAKLRDVYESVASRNAVLLHDLKAAGQVLDRAGIEWVPLKGAALLHFGIYPDRGLRSLSDLDILARPQECQRAWELLKELDYRVMADNAPDARHMPALVNRRGTVIELHRGIGSRAQSHVPVDFDTFRDEALESLRQHLCLHHDRDARLVLRGQVDLWFLNQALKREGLRPSPTFQNRSQLIRSLRITNRYDEEVYTRADGWLGLLFPKRETMVKRYGDQARGLQLYPLYASRLVRLRSQLPALRKNLAGYWDALGPG